MRLLMKLIEVDFLAELTPINISRMVLIQMIGELTHLVFAKHDSKDLFDADQNLVGVQRAVTVEIKLSVHPFGVLSELGYLVCDKNWVIFDLQD